MQHHTESDENGLAIQKEFQVCEPYFQQIQCSLDPSMYPIYTYLVSNYYY